MLDLSDARRRMVDLQLKRRGVQAETVLQAMGRVPRESFVPEALGEFAYEDSPLPIAEGQTISQPYIVALMIEAADVRPGDTVLEVGAGSGYAAAVLGQIAGQVYAIERHEALTCAAADRFARLGYRNIKLRTGDGSLGWPEAAPFDAILVAAGGPAVPQALKEQLEIGGRLVMPVGDQPRDQRLIKITRTSAGHFEEEDLGGVMFVPLVGEHGWPAEEAGRRPAEPRSFRPEKPATPAELIRAAAEPLPGLDDPAFGALFDRFAGAEVVLLGEATHGTSEFYRARAAITRRLIERHGFTTVAVEADWPDAASIDREVRGRPAPSGAQPAFQRFPTWMWRNAEVEAFTAWLKGWNARRTMAQRTGFFGLDLYNLSASIRTVLDYLDKVDPEAAQVARERYGCLAPWANEPQAYGRMALTHGYRQCEAAVVRMLTEMLARGLDDVRQDGDELLDATASARLVKNAEAYYRAMYYGAAESWNLRDTHMFETLEALRAARGPKVVVWAHNSHIGDASKTEMGLVRQELNLGQLCREEFGRRAALIGFGADTGTVACASDWDAAMEVKPINPALPDSYERLARDSRGGRFLLDLRPGVHEDLREALAQPRLERFIGVIYRPETERWSHYSACDLPQQFDAYVWFEQTTAVTPTAAASKTGPDETYPTGL
jgi:protein-L-isoaspartate(D-aspartate) O-methyltransferase